MTRTTIVLIPVSLGHRLVGSVSQVFAGGDFQGNVLVRQIPLQSEEVYLSG